MKAFIFVSIIVLFQSLYFVNASLEQICKEAKNDYNFCITSLQVVPESHKADTKGIAIIMAKLIQANLTHTYHLVKQLEASPNMSTRGKTALHDCVEFFESDVDDMKHRTLIRMIESHDIDRAIQTFSSVMDDIETCKDGWEELNKEPFPIRKEYEDGSNLCCLAESIVALLQ